MVQTTIVPTNGVTFNAASQPLTISLGTGSDNDTYTYYPDTMLMDTWSFEVGGVYETATITPNPINSIKSVAITDGFNAGGTQTCNFGSSGTMGYDDWNRLLSNSCGTGGATWNQSDSYDINDNLTKASTGFVSWNPGYGSSTNHYTCTGCTYDSNGNVTYDGTNAYTWNEFSKLKAVNSAQTPIYDAFGRMVEIDNGSSYTEIWYTQLGKTAFMNGTSKRYVYWPGPGGGTMLDTGNILWLHKDWLGNARIVSNVTAATVTSDRAFAPYGEVYNIYGGTAQEFTMFGGGSTQDMLSGMYDTPNRELQGSQQGRFLSPDPAGAGWNQYAYPTNPNSAIDPSGLLWAYTGSGWLNLTGTGGVHFSGMYPADGGPANDSEFGGARYTCRGVLGFWLRSFSIRKAIRSLLPIT
jgi:RHS repeat-associated protein